MDISINFIGKRELLEELKKVGFTGIDFGIRHPQWYDRMVSKEYHDFIMEKYDDITSAGLKVCQTHLPYWGGFLKAIGDGDYDVYEEYMLPRLIRSIELSSEMGARTAVMHPYYETSKEASRQGNLRLVEKLLPVCEKNGIILSLENIYGLDWGEANHSTPEDMLYYTDHFKNPYLGICLDTGHALIRGQKPEESLKKLGNKLTALHIHTNTGKDSHSLPFFMIGYDEVDWMNFSKILKESGYKDNFNLELVCPPEMSERALRAYFVIAYDIARKLVD